MDTTSIIAILLQIEEDESVPRNVRLRVRGAIESLQDQKGKSAAVRADKVMQELDELSNDPNIPMYTRTQIWNVLSNLESL